MQFLKIKEDEIINLDRIEVARVPETDFGGKLNIFMTNSATTISFSSTKQARLALAELEILTHRDYETYKMFKGCGLKEFIQQLGDDADENQIK